jgi:hypothetical protein
VRGGHEEQGAVNTRYRFDIHEAPL